MNLRALLVVSLLGFSLLPCTLVQAEDPPAQAGKKSSKKRAERSRPKQAASKKPTQKKSDERAAQPPVPVQREPDATKTRAQEAARAAAQDSTLDAHIVKEGETNVKVMTFTGLDIEGRLKSPQLLYFVNRVQAEFERPRLPHRSFMPELSRTTQREPLR